jgi:hypothetical protein
MGLRSVVADERMVGYPPPGPEKPLAVVWWAGERSTGSDHDGDRAPAAALGRHRLLPHPSPAELFLGAHGLAGLRLLLAGIGLGPEWVETYAGALADPGALAAALAWYRAPGPLLTHLR